MSLTKEDLLALSQMMDAKLQPIQEEIVSMRKDLTSVTEDLASVKEALASVKEDTTVTRSATNSLVAWADQVSVLTQIKFPVGKAQ